MGVDDDVIRPLFDYRYERDSIDIRSLTKQMCTASAHAREAVASFIRDNYKVDQRDDGM
jgi:hypothetical protein